MSEWFFRDNPLLVWPLVGLGIFAAAFLMVIIHVTVGLRHDRETERMAALPLADEATDAAGEGDVRS
jgi:cbb3-type cytochrome oxidase subunit 3